MNSTETGRERNPPRQRTRRAEWIVLWVGGTLAILAGVLVIVSAPPDLLLPGPDPSRAPEEKIWPTAEQLERLGAVEGKSRKRVVRLLGHPSTIETRPDGTEVWTYSWLAACQVAFRDGRATGYFYTAGY